MKDMTDVIIPAFNRPEETFLTIEALLETNDDVQVILVHDGSTEKPDLSSLDINRIVQIDLPHSGQAKALNAGFKLVKSEYVVVMDNDVIINDKNWVRKAVNFLKTNKEAGLIATIGVAYIYKDPLHYYCQYITSLIRKRGSFKFYLDIGMNQDFMEVWRTDNVVNIFKTGIKADERYEIYGLSFWIDVKAKGLKCYIMRFNDGKHLLTRSFNLEAYKKLVPSFKEQQKSVSKVNRARMEEFGMTLPSGTNTLLEKIRKLEKEKVK